MKAVFYLFTQKIMGRNCDDTYSDQAEPLKVIELKRPTPSVEEMCRELENPRLPDELRRQYAEALRSNTMNV